MDSGSGPGVSTRLLLESGFRRVAALDPSLKLLRSAKSKLGAGFDPVVGTSECLPFRTHVFSAVLTCFSLRDVRDLVQSLQEFARASRPGSLLAIVDVGKPDASFARFFIGLYIRYVMPMLARLLIRNRLVGNPFRMIVPTFNQLVTNHALEITVAQKFGSAKLFESMFGGLIIVLAVRGPRLDSSS